MLDESRDQLENLDNRINLLQREENPGQTGSTAKKVSKISRFLFYFLIIVVLAFFVFSFQAIVAGNSITQIFSGKINFFSQLNSLAGNGNALQGESDDRINVLLLGIGGAGHDGPYLTDTIMLASIQPSTRRVALISIPRDLLVNIPGHETNKINIANSYGEDKDPGNGGELSRQVIAETLGIEIPYYVRVDFNGFEKIIDDLDGVKVNVDNGFTDYQFPTNDYKFRVISFSSGWQTMDGATALDFARSRHGNNGEGSDFARSHRQQKILQALKQRVFSVNFFLSPLRVSKVMDTLSTHLRTNMEPWEIVRLATLGEKMDTDNIINMVIDDSPNGFLYSDNLNGAFVLVPKGNDFGPIRQAAQNVFLATNPVVQEVLAQKKAPTVEIKNGTTTPGLASKHAEELKLIGYNITEFGNAPTQNYAKTEIYQLPGRNLDTEAALLEKKYGVKPLTTNIPSWITTNVDPEIDFVIILGQDQSKQ